MSFSLIYVCCSFRGGILSVVFPTVARCFWPAGNLVCPCLFSDLIFFPFLLLFFDIFPYPSFSSMSFPLLYICCSFRGGILSAKYFFHSSTTSVVGGTLRWAWKTHFFIQYKKKLIISGDHGGPVFLLKRSSLVRNFRHPGLLLPKGNYVYDIYPYTWKRPNSLKNYIHRI